jgi:pimeloyl-ACP methyl ester carboxylesterase
LAILDVTIPGDGQPNISQGGKRWHHGFHQTEGLPEALVVGREALYLGWFYENYGARRDALDPLAIAEYLRVYTQPGALRAGFDYYRNLARDIADNQATLTRGKLTMPVLGLGGAKSWGRGLEVVHSLRRVATDVHGGVIEDAGHWLPEEQPDLVAQRLRDFFTAD